VAHRDPEVHLQGELPFADGYHRIARQSLFSAIFFAVQGSDQRDYAIDLFRQAYARQMKGEYEEALRLYARSIEAFPTAEAYTFRGWTYSFMGIWDKAIRECLRAIEIDPDFGNPYNDIGAYLIEQGKCDEALPWFEKALRAPRYEAYCYPWFNMGRIWEKKHDWNKARICYEKSLEQNPNYQVAIVALKKIKAMWN